MLEVKTFSAGFAEGASGATDSLERRINKWLKEIRGVKISLVHTENTCDEYNRHNLVVFIFYEKGKK